MYKKDLALTYLEGLIYHETHPPTPGYKPSLALFRRWSGATWQEGLLELSCY